MASLRITGMGLQPDDSDEISAWPVDPEYPAGGRHVVLEVRLEDFLAVPDSERADLVALETGMERVFLKVLNRSCEFLRHPSLGP